MTATPGAVGAQPLPVPVGASLSFLADPTIAGLLAYFGFWLKDSLDAKLTDLAGMSPDACPVANRFGFDPLQTWPRNPTPALYAWELKSKCLPWTLLHDARERELRFMYVFQELDVPIGVEPRSGIPGAVSATFTKARARGRHPAFGLGNDPIGTPIAQSLNLLSWTYVDGTPGMMMPIPGDSQTQGSNTKGQIQKVFPAFVATVRVLERVEAEAGTPGTTITTSINVAQDDDSDLYVGGGVVPFSDP